VHANKLAMCMLVGDLMLRNVGAEHRDMMVECFQGIKTEQLHKMIEKRHLGITVTVIVYMGTNDLRTTRNLDFLRGEVCALVVTLKRKFRTAHLSFVECCHVQMCHGDLLGHLMIDSLGSQHLGTYLR